MKMCIVFGCKPSAERQVSALRLLLVIACVTLVDGVSYMCLFPSYLRPNSDFNIAFTILQASGPVTIEASVSDLSGSVISTKSSVASASGVSVLLTVSIPIQVSDDIYVLKVQGSGGLSFANTTKLKLFKKPASVFIQTDKAKYKPGQKVLFRVVAIYPTMQPYTGEMNISIVDDEMHRMGQWRHKDPKGYFSGELQLSSRTPLGTWKIEVVIPSSAYSTIKIFEVTQYELPKFEVIIGSPLHYFLLIGNPQAQPALKIPITATYTYGESVKGTVSLAVSIIDKNKSDTDPTSDTDAAWTKNLKLSNGKAHASISPADLSSIVPDSLKAGTDGQPWTQLDASRIKITATVTEAATGDTITASLEVVCKVNKYSLYFSNITSGSFKSGDTYTGYLELKRIDGSAPRKSDIQLPSEEFRQIDLTFTADQSCSQKVVQNSFPLTKSGFVSFSFEPKDFNCNTITMEASFNDELSGNTHSAEKTIEKFLSQTQNYIKVDLDKMPSTYKEGDQLNFNIKTTQAANAFNYIVMSKGSIVLAQTVLNIPSIKLLLSRELAQQLSPRGHFVVWFVADNAEIISDSVEFNVDGAFANQVSITHGKKTVEPGTSIYIEIRGEPDSTAFVLGVDKSVLLLKSNNDISQQMAVAELMVYEVANERVKLQDITSQGIFDISLLGYMTDGIVYSSQEKVTASQVEESMETYTRSCFPETWIWSSVTIGKDGIGFLKVKVPDTITTWITSAFAIHEQIGLGIAPDRTEIKATLPLFVSTKFPSLVRSGEQFALKATVYNFLDAVQSVTVTLKASLFFNVQQKNGVIQNKDVSRQIKVPPQDALSVSFWIMPIKPGQIPVIVSAKTVLKEDIENRTLVVMPEGVEQFYTAALFIDMKKGAPNYTGSFTIEFPAGTQVVPNSQHIKVSIVGDILGPSLAGLEGLVDIPGSCGEQMMINVAPVFYIMEYLEETKSLTADKKVSCEKKLLDGYQQELTAQRTDKSFSAWGNNDTTGSIWLSAFVVKIFNAAAHKRRIPVEEEMLAETVSWIIQNQAADGHFSELDKANVYHVDMQGGSGNGTALTAYVLITLIESKINDHIDKDTLSKSISSATAFLENKLDSINDAYTLCIVTYALVLANSKRAGDAQRKRDALAQVAMDQKHWGTPTPVKQRRPGVFSPPYVKAAAIDVEMTSYALLTYVQQTKITEALPVVKWLLAQINPSGGFVSTQDTVVALEALTRYAKLAAGVRSTVNLKVKGNAGAQEKIYLPIDANNVFLIQEWEPKDTSVKTIPVSASGFGKAIVQLEVRYHVYSAATIANNGELSMNITTESNEKMVSIKTCARSGQTSNGPTGMALETIDPVSGYVPANLDEVDTGDNVKKIEVDGQQITIYYEKLDGNITCTTVKMKKEFAILNTKNATITCMDYYNPGKFVTAIYGFDEPKSTWESLCPTCAG